MVLSKEEISAKAHRQAELIVINSKTTEEACRKLLLELMNDVNMYKRNASIRRNIIQRSGIDNVVDTNPAARGGDSLFFADSIDSILNNMTVKKMYFSVKFLYYANLYRQIFGEDIAKYTEDLFRYLVDDNTNRRKIMKKIKQEKALLTFSELFKLKPL